MTKDKWEIGQVIVNAGFLAAILYLATVMLLLNSKQKKEEAKEFNGTHTDDNGSAICPDLFSQVPYNFDSGLPNIINFLEAYSTDGAVVYQNITENVLCQSFLNGLDASGFNNEAWDFCELPPGLTACPNDTVVQFNRSRGFNCINDEIQENCTFIFSYSYLYNHTDKQGVVSWGIQDNGPFILPNGTAYSDYTMLNGSAAFDQNAFPLATIVAPPAWQWQEGVSGYESPGYPQLVNIFEGIENTVCQFYYGYGANYNQAYCDALTQVVNRNNSITYAEAITKYNESKNQFENDKAQKIADIETEVIHRAFQLAPTCFFLGTAAGLIFLFKPKKKEASSDSAPTESAPLVIASSGIPGYGDDVPSASASPAAGLFRRVRENAGDRNNLNDSSSSSSTVVMPGGRPFGSAENETPNSSSSSCSSSSTVVMPGGRAFGPVE